MHGLEGRRNESGSNTTIGVEGERHALAPGDGGEHQVVHLRSADLPVGPVVRSSHINHEYRVNSIS